MKHRRGKEQKPKTQISKIIIMKSILRTSENYLDQFISRRGKTLITKPFDIITITEIIEKKKTWEKVSYQQQPNNEEGRQ